MTWHDSPVERLDAALEGKEPEVDADGLPHAVAHHVAVVLCHHPSVAHLGALHLLAC